MPTAADFEREKQELKTVLESGVFNRAPNLAHLLSYICSKYFEGEAEQIKEYNVAVEALGRSPNFDQKKDSIVRVEANRLRRRLREYYENEGASHPVHIMIPLGQYVPKFVPRESLPDARPAATEKLAAAAQTIVPLRESGPRRPMWPWISLALLAVCTILAVIPWSLGIARKRTVVAARDIPVATLPETEDIRILAGVDTGNFVDGLGRTWSPDRYFQGGATSHTAHLRIIGAQDPLLYESRREGGFRYDIPLKPGVYELRLHFVETLYGSMNPAGGGESSRLFNVLLNGRPLLQEFDVIADAGVSTADVKVFKDISPDTDGKLHLQFQAINNPPFVNAIEITPGISGRIRPIYLITRDRGYTDKKGVHWAPDREARGGQLVLRADAEAEAPDPELYRGERFGNLTYVIPVPLGRYGVTLHFAETWFGPKKQVGGGVGSRVFDVLCNGVALVRSFDIYKEAGRSDRAITRTFHGLTPNHQGKLVISMLPEKNYACINALEVVDESK
jgi:hypothetical protein